jgi:hypothetical protein
MLSSMHSDSSGGALSDALPLSQQVRQLDAAELICAGTAASTLEPRYATYPGMSTVLALWLRSGAHRTRESRNQAALFAVACQL